MLQRVAGTIDARALAVPDAEHAVDGAMRVGFDLLRAEQRRGGKVLVDGRQEGDVMPVEMLPGAPQLLVESAEGRTAIARDETRRI